MESRESANKISSTQEHKFNRTIQLYLGRWKWFAFSVLFFVISSFIYLKYTTKQYASNALIKLITLNNNPTPEEAILGELGLVYGGDKLHFDETKILRSRSLMYEVISQLHYNVKVFSEGSIKDMEMYTNSPIKVNFIQNDSVSEDMMEYFEINLISDSRFRYIDKYGVENTKQFGENIFTESGKVLVLPTDRFDFEKDKEKKLKVVINSVSAVATRYREKLFVQSFNDRESRSNMIMISITDRVPEKAAEVINKLIELYNQRSIDSKMQLAESTYEFINDRIAKISVDLNEVDIEKERFKVGNMLTDVTSESGLYMQAEVGAETELLKIGTKLNTVNYMIRFLGDMGSDSAAYEVIPINIGLDDPSISAITAEYNQLVFDRDRLLKSSGIRNPVILQINERLSGLRSSLVQSLNNLRSTLLIQQGNLNRQLESINTKIAGMPGQERQNRDIEREQNIKESIYLYLLQKREEAAISMATAYPSAEVIDPAVPNGWVPVSPKSKIVYLAALILGVLFPLMLFVPLDLLDDKIYSRADILVDKSSPVKIIAEIPSIRKPENEMILAEGMRILRTNLDFEVKKTPSKVIYVTSSINGEGKSFLAFNLAQTYSLSHNKVLLIGADLRKPNLQEFTSITNTRGVSEYLSGQATLEEILPAYGKEDYLHVIHSGKITPRPAELLMSNRIDEFFEELKKRYDIIVVDTAPTLLVTDTLLLGKYADQTLYVVRSGYTNKEILPHILELAEDKKLPHMFLVLNDVKTENLGYAGKYTNAYAYHDTDRPWYREISDKILSRLRR